MQCVASGCIVWATRRPRNNYGYIYKFRCHASNDEPRPLKPIARQETPDADRKPIAENSCCPHLDQIHLMRIVGNPRNLRLRISDLARGSYGGAV